MYEKAISSLLSVRRQLSKSTNPPADAISHITAAIGGAVALIGGVNQNEALDRGTPEQIRSEVFRLFAELGPGGGYLMSPSDHFFETPPENLR